MTRAIRNLLILTLLAFAGGYLGHIHPAGDSLAVFRPQLAVPLALLALILWVAQARKWALLGFGAAVMAVLPLFWTGAADMTDEANLTLYQKNMRFLVDDPTLLSRDILARNPDFITLQEVSGANMAVFDPLEATYPTRQFCPFETVGGVAVAARWPMVPGTGFCTDKGGLAGMQVDTPRGPVWVVSVHLHWPWPYRQNAHLKRLLPFMARLEGAKAIGGDFNMVPWGASVARVADVTDTVKIGPPHISLTKLSGMMRVPIDHVLVSGGIGTVDRLERLGSDHFGLFARFALPSDG